MRVFPKEVLRKSTTIGLNQAYKYAPVNFSITVHPELVLEYEGLAEKNETTWVVKKKPPMLKLDFDDPRYYVFNTSDNFDVFQTNPPDTLFCGRGVQQTAMHLAARMGADAIFLVGVDMCDLGGEHHGHEQHVRFHGLTPETVYREYRKYTAKARRYIREHFKIPVLTLSPLLGAGHGQEDYLRLCQEMGLPKLPTPKDTSPYRRPKPKL